MTAPHYLQAPFRYRRLAGVTDCQSVIDAAKDEVLNQLPVGSRWSDLGGDEVQSPPDADGRFVRVNFNRIAATNLEAVITDDAAFTFTRRAQFTGSVNVNLHSGPQHLVVDYTNGEGLWAAILDLFPRPQNDHAKYVVGNGRRTAADADDGAYTTDRLFERNTVDAYVMQAAVTMYETDIAGERFIVRTVLNARIGHPASVLNLVGVALRLAGRLPQALLVPPDEIPETDLVFPIDAATTATFRVTSIPLFVSGAATFFRLAMRKS